ncbi:hypothetical protein P5673_026624 [Acropora cervicornis]|uniref:Uncharacterized protein n=1 Tax=Acropora cervicornis TaxID=6130 RepID=A0AAD9Q0J6_ACRCE|nr:hypothetical protein P5673_026624 [Acropora cervicornis]
MPMFPASEKIKTRTARQYHSVSHSDHKRTDVIFDYGVWNIGKRLDVRKFCVMYFKLKHQIKGEKEKRLSVLDEAGNYDVTWDKATILAFRSFQNHTRL